MRSGKKFSEREISTFKQLFGIDQSGPDFDSVMNKDPQLFVRRETFGAADAEHNDQVLDTLMPRFKSNTPMARKSVDILPLKFNLGHSNDDKK